MVAAGGTPPFAGAVEEALAAVGAVEMAFHGWVRAASRVRGFADTRPGPSETQRSLS